MREPPPQSCSHLSAAEWEAARAAHISRVAPWTDDRVKRASLGHPHAVLDFLFTYYSFRPGHLQRWSPGADVVLTDCDKGDLDWPDDFVATDVGWILPAQTFPVHRLKFLSWTITYLSNIAQRTPNFSCFGLHEWAMVYNTPSIRHDYVPLRLSSAEIALVVEELGLRCSHYDAFRFFTPDAAPLNVNQLSRESTPQFDQRACIHVTMDLYKFAYKIAPWCPSELVADAFMLAVEARSVDMRASPYDLRGLGFDPICIETQEGRLLYLDEQKKLAAAAAPLRQRLIDVYEYLRNALTSIDSSGNTGIFAQP